MEELTAQYAKVTSTAVPSLTASLLPVTSLLPPKGSSDVTGLKEKIEMWVKGKKEVVEGGGEGGAVTPGLSMEDLQTYQTTVSGLLKSGTECSTGSAVYCEVDTAPRY